MTLVQAVILGVIQGLTEFFPVSSSGHLVLAQTLFGFKDNMLAFDIYVHFGTLLAVTTVFRRRIVEVAAVFFSGLYQGLSRERSWRDTYASSVDFRIAVAIIVGSVPAGVVGITLNDWIEKVFQSPGFVLVALTVTGIVLLGTFLIKEKGHSIGTGNGFIIGLAQAVAILPGISRSGATISTALFLGVKREEAGVFSFLLSLPAVLGATFLALKDSFEAGLGTVTPLCAITGVLVSWLTGWVALVCLMRVVKRGKIGYFGLYCIGVVAIFLMIAK